MTGYWIGLVYCSLALAFFLVGPACSLSKMRFSCEISIQTGREGEEECQDALLLLCTISPLPLGAWSALCISCPSSLFVSSSIFLVHLACFLDICFIFLFFLFLFCRALFLDSDSSSSLLFWCGHHDSSCTCFRSTMAQGLRPSSRPSTPAASPIMIGAADVPTVNSVNTFQQSSRTNMYFLALVGILQVPLFIWLTRPVFV